MEPDIGVDPASATPYQRQIFDQLRQAILTRRLAPGAKLPSTRMLAQALGVARNTVLFAFDQLVAEGYLETRARSGHFVTRVLPEDLLTPRSAGAPVRPVAGDRGPSPLSQLAQRAIAADTAGVRRSPAVPFAPEAVAADAFPVELWARLSARVFRAARVGDFAYGELAGYRPLRRALAQYLHASRGIECSEDHVLITSGAQQALDLVARVLLNRGDSVVVEDPSYPGTRDAFALLGGSVVRAQPVDGEGLIVEGLARLRPDPRLVVVTPSHQYPLGMAMSLRRRLALIDWAGRRGAWILEDDYDGEFRFARRPLLPLRALDGSQRVLYLGTLSRVLSPSLRMGYLVMRPELVDAFVRVRALSDDAPPQWTQAVVAEFLQGGHLTGHVRRMRALYAERRAALLAAARVHWPGLLALQCGDAGLQVTGWLGEGLRAEVVCAEAARHGVDVRPLSPCWAGRGGGGRSEGLILGFAGFDAGQIRKGARVLGAVMRGCW